MTTDQNAPAETVLRTAEHLAVQAEQRGFYADVAATGQAAAAAVTIEDRPAPDHVAQLLGVAPGTQVLVRDRVQGAEGQPPLQHSVSYFLPAIAEALPVLRDLNTGAGGYLARLESLGLQIEQVDNIRPALATAEQRTALQLPDPAAVDLITRVDRDQNGRVVHVMDLVRTDRNVTVTAVNRVSSNTAA
ncbi:UTRA domain-containing protein [Streptomyces kaniharaensis]|uniref:UTRA domain-containing protein n=1 Tax=Streptomyces kaniharaensis TaxID=212423 RepID=UPI0012969237|nr:UTRA domain-containing protein [Streptomyces kaniharaensis]